MSIIIDALMCYLKSGNGIDACHQAAHRCKNRLIGNPYLQKQYLKMEIGQHLPLKNFNGERIVDLYKDRGYMIKQTQKLGDPRVNFKITYINVGTEKKPILQTAAYNLWFPDNAGNSLVIYFNKAGDSMSGVYINLNRNDFSTMVRHYKTLQELRKDKDVLRIVGEWLNKDFITPVRGWVKKAENTTPPKNINTTA